MIVTFIGHLNSSAHFHILEIILDVSQYEKVVSCMMTE